MDPRNGIQLVTCLFTTLLLPPLCRAVILRLRQAGIYARPLGNVIYAMCSPITMPEACSEWLRTIHEAVRDVAANENAHREARAVHMPIV